MPKIILTTSLVLAPLVAFLLMGCSDEGENQVKQPDKTYKLGQMEDSSDHKTARKTDINSEPMSHIKFRKFQVFGSTDTVIVGQIASFAVDEQNRLFVADESQTTVEVFNPDGSYRTSLGRQGNGPGEFTAVTPNTMLKMRSDRLYVPDYVNGSFFPTRLQVFSLDSLAFIHTIQLLAPNKGDYKKIDSYYPNRIYPRAGGNFLVGYRRYPGDYRNSTSFIRYMIQDGSGRIISGPILEQRDQTNLTFFVKNTTYPYLAVSTFPFFAKSLLAVSENDKLFTAWSGVFEINVYDPTGKHLRSFRHAFSNKPFDKEKVIARYQKTGYKSELGDGVAVKMVQHASNLPDTWPALHSMFFDDQHRLWVSTIIDSKEVYKWWILKPSGQVMVTFKWPRKKLIKTVRNGFMYTSETNAKGINQVVKYKIQFKKTGEPL